MSCNHRRTIDQMVLCRYAEYVVNTEVAFSGQISSRKLASQSTRVHFESENGESLHSLRGRRY